MSRYSTNAGTLVHPLTDVTVVLILRVSYNTALCLTHGCADIAIVLGSSRFMQGSSNCLRVMEVRHCFYTAVLPTLTCRVSAQLFFLRMERPHVGSFARRAG